ncbi:MAG: AMP-binding protein [Geminicoccaceae bacterium]|nr:AMP-binding protein [Geminicoccaceae bacterium]
MSDPLTLGQLLSAQARLRPQALAVRDLERSLTFHQWNQRACRLANALVGIGLERGDRVAVLAYNRLEWAEIYAATAKAGLIAVPINFRLVGSEARHVIEDSGARALIVEEELSGVIDSVRDTLSVDEDRYILMSSGGTAVRPGYRRYEELLAAGAPGEPRVDVGPDDTWCLMYTSGTTGAPKGAIRNHRNMAMLALMTQVELGLHRRDEALLVMPMCHANSLFFFMSFIYCGGAVTIFSRSSFDPELCLRTFADTGATFTSLVPTHYTMLLETPASSRRGDFTRVEKLMISSAPAHAETKRAVMAMFPNSGLFELYGSTEAGWVTMLHPHEQFDKLGTVGRETVGSAPIRLLDGDGAEVPDGTPGELFSCGPYCFQGYWNLPEKTAEAFRGPWLSVGDVALRDEDGFIRLIDRKNNLIISGGENIYPSEVETVIADHPAVRDVAVIGRSDPKWGESVLAAIVCKSGMSASETEIIEFTRQRLAGYKRPRGVVFLDVEEMPRNATGKILHKNLRELLSKRFP